jgi:Mg2+ and Co2+ transporter CorA
MTYAIIYGCPLVIERIVLQRLSSVEGKPVHPLLLPGIIAEIESTRHARVVDESINEVEAKIFELDSQPNIAQNLERAEIEKRNEAKRSAWLDLTYLRNSLHTWNAQLRTMSSHALELEDRIFMRARTSAEQACDAWTCNESFLRRSRFLSHVVAPQDTPVTTAIHERNVEDVSKNDHAASCPHHIKSQIKTWDTLIDIGYKIKRRLDTIGSEYEERIRDCTMRVDGMAMATQWVREHRSMYVRKNSLFQAHGETTVEMATATNKESNVMKSISLVTMIFLPGTFFAVRSFCMQCHPAANPNADGVLDDFLRLEEQ